MSLARTLAVTTALAVPLLAFASTAQAKHHHGHYGHHHHAHAAKVAPAVQRPGYVGLAAVPTPGLVDLGLGPVFPFGGWPK